MKEKIEIRDYIKGDFNEILLLWDELRLKQQDRGDSEDVVLETIKRGGKMIIMTDKDIIIGTAWLTTDGRRLYLSHFIIKSEYQGRKLAHILLDECFKYAKKLNLQFKLRVNRENEKAINLYKNAGFKYLGDYDTYIIRDIQNIKLSSERNK